LRRPPPLALLRHTPFQRFLVEFSVLPASSGLSIVYYACVCVCVCVCVCKAAITGPPSQLPIGLRSPVQHLPVSFLEILDH
jgi:hypothetical protein